MPHEDEPPKRQGASASAQPPSSLKDAAERARGRPRSRRLVRRPIRYSGFFNTSDEGEEDGRSYLDQGWQSTDSEAEEDARIERSMGVIRKNVASRGSEGGTKYHCDV